MKFLLLKSWRLALKNMESVICVLLRICVYISGTPLKIWSSFRNGGGIGETSYDYFMGREQKGMKCMICDREFEYIGTHLKAHRILMCEYRKQFPGAVTMSESLHDKLVARHGIREIDCVARDRKLEQEREESLKRFAARSGIGFKLVTEEDLFSSENLFNLKKIFSLDGRGGSLEDICLLDELENPPSCVTKEVVLR